MLTFRDIAIAVVGGGAVGGALMFGFFSLAPPGAPPKFDAGDRVTVQRETWVCDRAARDDLGRQSDRAAFGVLIRQFQARGRCLELAPGTSLDVLTSTLIDGGTHVRISGRPEDWWVTTAVLEANGVKVQR